MTINDFLAELNTFTDNLKNIIALTGDDIGQLSVASVKENFNVGGRPKKWAPSQRAIRENNKTLIDSGALYDSITFDKHDNVVSVGSDVEYASEMNDQREFLLLQEEDVNRVEDLIWKALGL